MASSRQFAAGGTNLAADAAHQNGGGVLLQKDMTFVISPPELNFHGFQPHKQYKATLTLKNQTRTTKFIRIVPPESRFFSISEPHGTGDSLKVAPGLSLSYTVYFKPEEDVDYECDLIAISEHEKFIIPVRSIGSRGKLCSRTWFTLKTAQSKEPPSRRSSCPISVRSRVCGEPPPVAPSPLRLPMAALSTKAPCRSQWNSVLKH